MYCFLWNLVLGTAKYATGLYGEQLKFQIYQSPVKSAVIKVIDKSFRLMPYDDLNYQATTGAVGLWIIYLHKAVFKETTDNVGNIAIMSGTVLASREQSKEAGFAVLGAGLLSKAISSATTPAA